MEFCYKIINYHILFISYEKKKNFKLTKTAINNNWWWLIITIIIIIIIITLKIKQYEYIRWRRIIQVAYTEVSKIQCNLWGWIPHSRSPYKYNIQKYMISSMVYRFSQPQYLGFLFRDHLKQLIYTADMCKSQ